MLDPVVETEIAALAARYGPPRRVAVDLDYQPFSPLTLEDRYGEVCMIVLRANGRLLTAKKTFYPPGAFRVDKYWSPVNRVDNVYGDRNLVCSCPPLEDYAEAAE